MRTWAVLWVASLIVVALFAASLARAQAPQADARIVSGADIGFRVESISRAGEPIGTIVIRVKGEWVPVGFNPGVRPAH